MRTFSYRSYPVAAPGKWGEHPNYNPTTHNRSAR